MPAQQAERNRDLEIATCTANRPVVPLRLQSRFLNRGSFPELADFTKFHARQYTLKPGQGVQLQARREWTREWWEVAKWSDALVTSPVVIAELEETPDKVKLKDMLELINDLPRLLYTDEIDMIVEVHLKTKSCPWCTAEMPITSPMPIKRVIFSSSTVH